jgi:hypothetical protein
MCEAVCRPLIEVLAEVPDFRKSRGKRHSLTAILALACAAMLCGYKSYGAIAEWGHLYGAELARKLGFQEGKTPSVGTLHTVFRHLDKKAFEACLGTWAESALQHAPTKMPLQGIAIDGKTLRGSRKQGACDTHVLSAVSHGLGLTLYQHAVDDKTNEITAVHEVLSHLILEGRVITVDALLTQKSIAADIRQKGGTT